MEEIKKHIRIVFVAIIFLLTFSISGCALTVYECTTMENNITNYTIGEDLWVLMGDWKENSTIKYKQNIYDCTDMTRDLGVELEENEYDCQYVVGNIINNGERIKDINHCWLMCEVQPNIWIPVETTIGEPIDAFEGGYTCILFGVLIPYKNYYGMAYRFDTVEEYDDFLKDRSVR